jgi:hypothetical protein
MWLLIVLAIIVVAIAALIVGNRLRKLGVEEARANPYRSPASLAGQRKSGLGTWLNIVGSICLIAAVALPWLWPNASGQF